jgi:geranylgeranyl diphosphate synthase, type I
LNSAININELRYKIDDYITFCLANEESLCFLKNRDIELFDEIEAFVARKAKRIRPILLMLSFVGYSKKGNSSMIHAAVSLELMHTFALIHDDIIDCTPMRDVTPSLYHAIDKLAAARHLPGNGDGMAMLIGDLIYNIALMEFQKLDVPPSVKTEAMELLLSTALKTGHGQLLELVDGFQDISQMDEDEVFNIYDLKTASYTFCLPLKMGAVLAGIGKKEQNKLDELGLKLGRAFQIIDDIDDLGKGDAVSFNLLLLLLWQKADMSDRKTLTKILADRKMIGKHLDCLADLYHKYEITRCASRIAFGFIQEALDAIEELSINNAIKAELSDYIGSIMKFSQRR